MTLNDLEWLNGHFTLNIHYYELAFRVLLAGFEGIFYLFTVEYVYMRVTSRDVGSGVADRDPQNIWFCIRNPQSAEKLLIFLRRYIVGILTNKANISI